MTTPTDQWRPVATAYQETADHYRRRALAAEHRLRELTDANGNPEAPLPNSHPDDE